MSSVDVGVALLGYGTVGASVNRLLVESAEEIERATGHRLRVVRALVRDASKERPFAAADGVLTTDFAAIRDDPSVDVVVEVMGGLDPAGGYVRELLAAGKSVVTANKQLVARQGADLFAIASAAGVQLRFEASVFGYAEADPTDDVNGADAAAKMAILATVAFGSRVTLDDVETRGITEIEPTHVSAAAQLGMVVRLVGIASLVDGRVDVRVQPALVERSHPLAAVDGAFNAVMLQGDAIREITLEGPGAGGIETASAVVADLVSVVGTAGTGFLQNDACWRELEFMPEGEWRSPFYAHLDVADRPGVLAHAASRLAAHDVSVAQLVQRLDEGRAAIELVLHAAPIGAVNAALVEIAALQEVLEPPFVVPVISERPL